jgi:hypothetical protein
MPNVDLADWTKERLEEVIEEQGHKSYDSAVRSLLLNGSNENIGPDLRWQSRPTIDLVKAQNGDLPGMSGKVEVLRRVGSHDSGMRMKQVTDVHRLNSWHQDLTTVTVSQKDTYTDLVDRLDGSTTVVDGETEVPLFGVAMNEAIDAKHLRSSDRRIAVSEVQHFLSYCVRASDVEWKMRRGFRTSSFEKLVSILLTQTGNGVSHEERTEGRATLSDFCDVLEEYHEEPSRIRDNIVGPKAQDSAVEKWEERIGNALTCIEDFLESHEEGIEQFEGGNDIEIELGELSHFQIDVGQEEPLVIEALVLEILRQARMLDEPVLIVLDDIFMEKLSGHTASSLGLHFNTPSYQIAVDHVSDRKCSLFDRGKTATELYRHDPSKYGMEGDIVQELRSLDVKASPDVAVEFLRVTGSYDETTRDELVFIPSGEEASIAREANPQMRT